MKVCHFTSAHDTNDIRIFIKECQSLCKAGHEVYLVGKGEDREEGGVHIIGCGNVKGRIKRFLTFSKTVYRKALSLDCDVYHFHDPELLPYGRKLKRKGKIVIFDSHEDVPSQILDKPWIPKPFRKLVSSVYRRYETTSVKHLDAVVAATPHIGDKFNGRVRKVAVVNNYPKFDDVLFQTKSFLEREKQVCYVGSISEVRGDSIMREAMKKVDAELIVAGSHDIETIGNVRYVGKLDRAEVNKVYGESMVGLCILKPIENYYYSQPIKMYEYMVAGLPFVCSDFPGWKEIVDASGCGICVNPEDTDEIAKAIGMILDDPQSAQEMGVRGHDYVMENCNWENEEKTLVSFYHELERQSSQEESK